MFVLPSRKKQMRFRKFIVFFFIFFCFQLLLLHWYTRTEKVVGGNIKLMKNKFDVWDLTPDGVAVLKSAISSKDDTVHLDDIADSDADGAPVLKSFQLSEDNADRARVSKPLQSSNVDDIVASSNRSDVVHDGSHSEDGHALVDLIPVLLLVCNRPGFVRSLDSLLSYRLRQPNGIARFPIFVSQDCNDRAVSKIIRSYGDKVIPISQPDQSKITVPVVHSRFAGYYKISRHYKWALEEILYRLNYDLVIVMEDDLEIAADFFDYFWATAPMLLKDTSLFCVSAWNDNGKESLIDVKRSDLLYRTDFFPGLGWMLSKNVWAELRDVWPPAFWDDIVRRPNVTKGRSCIRPEISRTFNFGKIGVSNGAYYDEYLRGIYLNKNPFNFSSSNLSYLQLPVYDENFLKAVYTDAVLINMKTIDLLKGDSTSIRRPAEYRMEYTNYDEYFLMTKYFGAMTDLRANIPRTAYKGVVALFFHGLRIYLAPPSNWTSY